MKEKKIPAFIYSAAGLVIFLICWQLLVMFTNVGNISRLLWQSHSVLYPLAAS